MTKDDLDLARAKDAAFSRGHINNPASVMLGHSVDSWWEEIGPIARLEWIHDARAIRLGDEARGLRVVPVEATEEMRRAGGAQIDRPNVFMDGPKPGSMFRADDTWRAMISVSPFAPGDGE